MKYIMFNIKGKTVERKLPIIFPNILVHEYVADVCEPMIQDHFHGMEITLSSAGDYDPIRNLCFGESTSLKLKAHSDDSGIIQRYDYFHGI